MTSALLVAACSFDWDAYDPRLGDSPDASAGGSAGGSSGAAGATAGGAGGTGGNGGASGSSGGTAGAGGSGGASGASGAGGSGGAAGTGGSAGAGGTGVDAGPVTKTYPVAIAECVALVNPDPDVCETATGAGHMAVDLLNSAIPNANPDPPTAAFVSFALDNAFAGKQVLSVTLEITVGNGSNAQAPASGEVWEVESFTVTSLSGTVPAKQGSAALAPDQGAVTQQQVVSWSLPTGVVSAGQTLYLGVFPTAMDGVDYAAGGTDAPTLTVQYQ